MNEKHDYLPRIGDGLINMRGYILHSMAVEHETNLEMVRLEYRFRQLTEELSKEGVDHESIEGYRRIVGCRLAKKLLWLNSRCYNLIGWFFVREWIDTDSEDELLRVADAFSAEWVACWEEE